MGQRYPKRTQLKYTKQRYRVQNWRGYEAVLFLRTFWTFGLEYSTQATEPGAYPSGPGGVLVQQMFMPPIES